MLADGELVRVSITNKFLNMKIIKNKSAVAFRNLLIVYGRFVNHNYYMIEIRPSLFFGEIILYKGYSKPIFRNITTIAILCFPFCFIRAIIETILYMLWCPFEFFVKTIIKESFVNSIYEKVGGYIMFFCMLYGIFRFIVG